MKQLFTLVFAGVFTIASFAQNTLLDFEDFALPIDTFLNGSDFSGGFESQGVFFPNDFQSTMYGDFWLGGWAISTMTDSMTTGFGNLYSAKAAGGFDDSDTYAIGQQGAIVHLGESLQGHIVEGAYFTNSTYAYNSMREGDDFAKKFGGVDGTEPDYFRLSVFAFSGGQLGTDSVDFYLADFRFENSVEDYLVADWQWVDLSSLGPVDSLYLVLSSSDASIFDGITYINTPTFYCMDDLTISGVSSQKEVNEDHMLTVFPNPTSGWLKVVLPQNEDVDTLGLWSSQGQLIDKWVGTGFSLQLDISHLPKGMYLLKAEREGRTFVQKVIKQ